MKRSQEDVVELDDEDRPAKKVSIVTQPPRKVQSTIHFVDSSVNAPDPSRIC